MPIIGYEWNQADDVTRWVETYVPLTKILIKDSTGKIISRNTENTAWIDTLETTIEGISFETYGMESSLISSLTSIDWDSLYNDINFTAPFEFQVFKEEDIIPVLTETTTENEFGVIARSFEVEIDETELEKVRNLVVQ